MTDVFPIWAQNLRTLIVRREFRTDILTSRAGREQRRALRVSPRKYLEFQSAFTGDLWRLFNTSMMFGQRTSWYFPDQSRVASIPAGATTNVAVVSSAQGWMLEGAKVVLRHETRLEVYTIDAVAGATVTLIETPAEDWPAGTLMYPAVLGWLRGEVAGQALRGAVVDVGFGVEVEATEELIEPALLADATFNGRDVWTLEPFAFRPAGVSYVQYREIVDAGMGPVSRFHPVEFASRVWRAEFPMSDPDNADKVRSFFETMRGAQGEFYMPTFEYDLRPKVQASAGTATLRVAGTLTHTAYAGSTTHKCVLVTRADGSKQYNLLVSMAINAGDTVLTFADTWDDDVAITDRVSWMPVWRFASDILDIQWIFDWGAPPTRWATAVPMLTMLEDLPVESP